MPIALAILAAVLCAYVSAWIAVLWVGERIGRRWSGAETGRADALFKPEDRLAVHQTYAPFIAMPEQLQTKEEMVDWMTKELPKLTVEKHKPVR